MIANDKTVKISDFGLAGIFENRRTVGQTPRSLERSSTARPNQTIPVRGTLTHMPPEQFIDSASCDQRSDIYSFGVVLYEMASGRLPFFVPPPSGPEDRAWGWTEIMWKLHSESPVPRLNSKLFPVIRHCLEKKPHRRYQTFKELRKDLETLLERTNGEKIKPPTLEELKPWEWGNKGVSLNDLGCFEEALHCHNRAIELNPRSETAVKAWSNKALTLRALNRLDEALECCDRASSLDPAYVPNLTNEAVILNDLGRHEESVKCCDQALQLDPNNSNAWNNKGIALGKMQPAEALICFEKALGIDPRRAEHWCNAASSLQSLRRFDEAIRCCDKAIALDPNCFSAWNDRGNCLNQLNRFEEALPCFAKANELDPKNPVAWFNQGAALHHLGRLEEAIGFYQRALGLAPRYSDVWFNKALAEEKLGRMADAVHSYEQLILVGDASAQSQIDHARKRLSEWSAGRNGCA